MTHQCHGVLFSLQPCNIFHDDCRLAVQMVGVIIHPVAEKVKLPTGFGIVGPHQGSLSHSQPLKVTVHSYMLANDTPPIVSGEV